MRAFLGQVRRREIDRYPLGGKRHSRCKQGTSDALPALAHRLVGQTNNVEDDRSWPDLNLNIDRNRLDPLEGHCRDATDHAALNLSAVSTRNLPYGVFSGVSRT